jgi:hypothetical protein
LLKKNVLFKVFKFILCKGLALTQDLTPNYLIRLT